MQSVLWAFGSMLVLMLIIAFLPLGFTKKGKFIVVIFGLVLALGGIVAVSSFPLWQTALLLLILSFFAAYIMQSRMGSFMFEEQAFVDEGYMDVQFEDTAITQVKKNINTELEYMDLDEIDVASSPVIKDDDIKVGSSLKQIEIPADIDEDISFLQDRNKLSENEDVHEESELEVSYLSEIESLLIEDSLDNVKTEEEDFLGEIAELKSLEPFNEELGLNGNEEDHFIEDLFIASKETAIANIDSHDQTETNKTLKLHK